MKEGNKKSMRRFKKMGDKENKVEVVKEILRRSKEEGISIMKLCDEYGMNRTTFYRTLNKLKEENKEIEGQLSLVDDGETSKEVNADKQVFDKSKRVKKTFELYKQVDWAIKLEALRQGKKVVDFVNEVLWNAVSQETREETLKRF